MPVLPQPALLGRHSIHPHCVPARPPPVQGLLARTEQLRGKYHQLLSPQDEAELVTLAQDGIRLERLGLELRRIQGRAPSMQQWATAACMDSSR